MGEACRLNGQNRDKLYILQIGLRTHVGCWQNMSKTYPIDLLAALLVRRHGPEVHTEASPRADRRTKCGPKDRAAQPRVHLPAPTNLFEARQIRTRRFLEQTQPEFRHDCQQVIEDVRLDVFVYSPFGRAREAVNLQRQSLGTRGELTNH